MFKKIIILAVLSILLYSKTSAQVFTGGNVSISYENGLYADIAPVVGYQVNQLRAGVSPILSYKVSGSLSNFSLGGRIFSQYTFIKGAFAHAELQALNTQTSNIQSDGSRVKNRVWTIALPVGGGYEYQISEKAKFQVTLLYDLLQDKNSPAGKPTIRGGIVYNL